jgi:DNA polymerase-1
MNQIDSMIQEEGLEAFMLLQIHDELIFEVKEEKVEEISRRFVHIMEHVLELDVPLKCSVSVGESWGELK